MRIFEACTNNWQTSESKDQVKFALIATVLAVAFLVPGILALNGTIPIVPYKFFSLTPGMTLPGAVSMTVMGSLAGIAAIGFLGKQAYDCAKEYHRLRLNGSV